MGQTPVQACLDAGASIAEWSRIAAWRGAVAWRDVDGSTARGPSRFTTTDFKEATRPHLHMRWLRGGTSRHCPRRMYWEHDHQALIEEGSK